MSIDKLIVEAEESSSFDCKKTFYKLPEKKFELVKDIVAMANSTRKYNKSSYILIGKKGDLFFDVHFHDMPDEADIQQMVNSMVDPPVKFSIKKESYNNHSLLLIDIPHSTRKPHFLTKLQDSQGKEMKAGQCFIRRGSSTALANRIEVAEMVYDADSKVNPFMKLVRYVEGQQKAGVQVSAEEFEKLMYHDFMPSLSISFNGNTYYVATNSDGVLGSRKMIGGNIPEEQENILSSVNEYIDEKRYDLAENLFLGIPEKEESMHCCIIGGALFAKLNKLKESSFYFSRAFYLDPNNIYLNFRHAESLYDQGDFAKSIAYYEKTLELCDNNKAPDIYRASLCNLGIVYYSNKIFKRSMSLLTEFIDISNGIEAEQRLIIERILTKMKKIKEG